MNRLFAHVEDGTVVEVIPPLPLTKGWEEILPEDGDARKLYGYPESVWVEVTGVKPMPSGNWTYADGKFSPPESLPVAEE